MKIVSTVIHFVFFYEKDRFKIILFNFTLTVGICLSGPIKVIVLKNMIIAYQV